METYDEILGRMVESYEAYSGIVPSDASDIMIRLKVLAGEIYRLKVYADYISRQLFPATASGSGLDMHAAERGLARKYASKASGEVVFYPEDEEHPDILIPRGTEVCTYGDMLRFVTDDDEILSASDESVTVNVVAAETGSAYNVRTGTINMIVTPVTGIGRVENLSAMEGGCDAETDEELRQRLVDTYVNISNGANAAYYRGIAMSVEGVYSAAVVGRGRGNGTVDVYICAKGAPVASGVKDSVQALLTEGRELNVDVLARDASPLSVSLYILLRIEAGYAFDEVSALVRTAVSEYITALGIGKDVLLSDIGEVIYHVKGVAGYRFLDSYGSDVFVSDSEYPTVGTINITEVT